MARFGGGLRSPIASSYLINLLPSTADKVMFRYCLCVSFFVFMCVCSRSRLLKKLWTKECSKSWRSTNGVATCVSAKIKFHGFQNF